MEDADLVRKVMNLDDAPRPIGLAIIIAAERDQAFMADAAFQF